MLRKVFQCFMPIMALILATSSAAYERRTPIVSAVEKAGPAVVNIRTEQIIKRQSSPLFGFGDSFFENFFREFAPPRIYKTQSLGSGVIIDAQGHVLTNAHVIEKASKIYVALPERRTELEATLVGVDERIDLAILQIVGEGPFPFLPPGTSSDLLPGETVIAIGNPLGLGHSITTGVISSPRRRIPVDGNAVAVFIQTDALINPGNSGGPLININGELIGINTAIARQAQGIGFSIPISVASRVLNDLIEYGRIRRPYLGVLPGRVGKAFAASQGGGVLVTEVDPQSPAAMVGIRLADVILAVDDVIVESPEEFLSVLRTFTPGEGLRLSILRGLQELVIEARLGVVTRDYLQRYIEEKFGFSVVQGASAVQVGKVRAGSAAAAVGVQRGDLIAEVEGGRLADEDGFFLQIEEAIGRLPLRFLVVRGNQGYYVDLP